MELFGGVIDCRAFGENFGDGDVFGIAGSGEETAARPELLSPCAPATIAVPAVMATATAVMRNDLFMHCFFHGAHRTKLRRSAQ